MQEQANAGLAELRSAIAAVGAARAKLHELRENFHGEAEQQLLNLSMEIARKVLMQEIKAERYEIDPIVREALSRLPAQTDSVTHLHPDDLARCQLASGDEEIPGVSFVADPDVRRGECLVATSHGTVESSVEGHLQEIATALAESE